jgi:hypothetical protein
LELKELKTFVEVIQLSQVLELKELRELKELKTILCYGFQRRDKGFYDYPQSPDSVPVHIGASRLHLRMYHDSYKQRLAVTSFSPLQRGS